MKQNWTKDQQKALEKSDKLTVVSAAAGSGKTTVLVEYVMRLLLDEENPVSADRFLIATFSNEAAKEFKNRIEKAINQRIKQEPKNLFYKTQKASLQKADIQTIHSFCIKLVRENFQSLGINADFTICDDAKSSEIHALAIEQAMIFAYSKEDFKDFVSFYGRSSQDKDIREFLLNMHHFFQALAHSVKQAQKLKDEYIKNSKDLKNSIWYKSIISDIKRRADYIYSLSENIKKANENSEVIGYEDGIYSLSNHSQNLLNATKSDDVDKILQLLEVGVPALGRVKNASDDSKRIKEIHALYKKEYEKLKEYIVYLNEEVFKEHMQKTTKYTQLIFEVFEYYQSILFEIKKEKNAFEFSDFEHLALELLEDENNQPTALAKSLQEHYYCILEDEFQDTNFVQDAIFTKIAKEDEKNLYVVGDVKQSIYGFRKASPEIFLEKRQRGIDDETKANTVFLSHNFRSDVSVINGVNAIFNRIMTKQVGGVDYEDFEFLQSLKEDKGEIGVEVNIYSKDTEAQNIAYKINSLIKEGYLIKDKGGKRKVRPSDFAILLRGHSKTQSFKDALMQYNYQSYVKSNDFAFDVPEVESVISMLRVISNPYKEVPLFAVMFGDLISFNLDEILDIKKSDKKQNLYKLLLESDDEKAKNLINLLKEFQNVSYVYSIDKLIEYICKKTQYYEKLALSENAMAKRENLRFFISFAKEYASATKGNLNSFLNYLDSYIQNNKMLKKQGGANNDSVNIMTMHTSKGLEFPICFVADLSKKFNEMDFRKRLFLDTQLGYGIYANTAFGYNNSTIAIKSIKNKMLKTRADDEMRLLYVALTRAKNLLFLSGEVSSQFTQNSINRIAQTQNSLYPHPQELINSSNMLEWILRANLDNSFYTNQYHFLSFKDSKDKMKINIVDEEIVIEEVKTKEEIRAKQYDISAFKENLAYVYKDKEKTTLPIKVSVSEVVKTNPITILQVPAFIKNTNQTAMQKGTSTHVFAQFCDIKNARENFEKEVLDVCSKYDIDKDLLKIDKLKAFVNSKMGDMILKADEVYKEADFLVPYFLDEEKNEKEVLLQGIIDCVLIKGEKVTVIDYKTDNIKSLEVLKRRYKPQLDLYKRAAKYLYNKEDIDCLIYSFELNDFIKV